MRKSISTNALPELGMVEAMVLTKAPISQTVQCLVSVDVPDNIFSGGGPQFSKDMVACMLTPPDPPTTQRSILTPPNYYMERAEGKEGFEERYFEWVRRMRKRKAAMS
jgi:hypothetical protein